MNARYLHAAGAAALAWSGGVAHAQAAPPTEAQPAAANGGLAEIIVTAQRKVESSQKAGIAIDVVSGKDLIKAGTINAQSLNAVAPALVITELGGPNTSFFVRGVGNFTGNPYSDPAIAFSLDGVYLGRATSTAGTFYDLERVEVLKGPQGTLYGRNATGGAVNVLPAKPVLGDLSGAISAGYGNYNDVNLEAEVNAPLGDKAAIRIAGKLARHDGYNSDGTDDLDSKAFRVQVLFKPSADLSIRIGADYSFVGGKGPGAQYDGIENPSPGSPATATSPANYTFAPANLPSRIGLLSPAAAAYYSTVMIEPTSIFPAPLSQPYESNNYFGVYGEINWTTDLGTLTVIPAYRGAQLHTDFNGPSFAGALLHDKDKQVSIEARFAGKQGGTVDWLLGGYYFNEAIDALDTYSQYFVQSYQNFGTGTKSAAAFGRLTVHATDKLRFIGGLRYTHDAKYFNGGSDTLLEFCGPVFGGPGPCQGGPSVPVTASLAATSAQLGFPIIPGVPVSYGTKGNTLIDLPYTQNATQDSSKATFRLAGEYDIAPRVLAYASYETGYRSGGFSLAPGYETYLPETLDAATLGIKSRFLANRVQLNLELFHWKYHNQQVAHFGVDATGATNNFTQNIGQATIQGFDFDGRFLLTPMTLLTGSVQYLDTKLNSFSYVASPVAGNLPPVTGCAVTATTVYTVDCSGKPESNSPKWSINLGAEQTVHVGDYKIVANGAMRYRSNRNTGFEYLPQQQTGADTLFDAGLAFSPDNEKWVISAYVRNIGNVAVQNITQFIGADGNTVTTQLAPPRTYGLTARVKF